MQTFALPYSGRLLVTQMAAYGLGVALQAQDVEAFLCHDPQALDLTPLVTSEADLELIADCVRASAEECEVAVERDVVAGKHGNDRVPALRARATSEVGAEQTLRARECLLDELEEMDAELPMALAAGLGAPAIWLREQRMSGKVAPARGATALDGVPYNIGSDIVRSALRRSRLAATKVVAEDVALLAGVSRQTDLDAADAHRWSMPGTTVALWCQWLAALGMCLLPVGLQGHAAARTPGYVRDRLGGRARRQLTLPILSKPTSLPRLRAVLQLQGLADPQVDVAASARLRTFGVHEAVTFPVRDSSNGSMVSFYFDLGIRAQL